MATGPDQARPAHPGKDHSCQNYLNDRLNDRKRPGPYRRNRLARASSGRRARQR